MEMGWWVLIKKFIYLYLEGVGLFIDLLLGFLFCYYVLLFGNFWWDCLGYVFIEFSNGMVGVKERCNVLWVLIIVGVYLSMFEIF